jgi:ubiquitin carboxyl-terminal hydrolase 7
VQDLEAQSLYSSTPQFYDFLQNRVLVQFKPRFEDLTGKIPDFDLVLSKKMTYEVVSRSTSLVCSAHSDRWHTGLATT